MTTVAAQGELECDEHILHRVGNELRSIVGMDVRWHAAQHKQVRQRLDHGMCSIWSVVSHCVV